MTATIFDKFECSYFTLHVCVLELFLSDNFYCVEKTIVKREYFYSVAFYWTKEYIWSFYKAKQNNVINYSDPLKLSALIECLIHIQKVPSRIKSYIVIYYYYQRLYIGVYSGNILVKMKGLF